jgi:hypothetical protein
MRNEPPLAVIVSNTLGKMRLSMMCPAISTSSTWKWLPPSVGTTGFVGMEGQFVRLGFARRGRGAGTRSQPLLRLSDGLEKPYTVGAAGGLARPTADPNRRPVAKPAVKQLPSNYGRAGKKVEMG